MVALVVTGLFTLLAFGCWLAGMQLVTHNPRCREFLQSAFGFTLVQFTFICCIIWAMSVLVVTPVVAGVLFVAAALFGSMTHTVQSL